MARTISTNALDSINAVHSGEVFLWLLTLTHPNFADVLVVNNNEEIISNGLTYSPFPFNITLHNDDKSPPKVKLVIDNVDRSLIDEIREQSTPITVDLKLIIASLPDLIEIEYSGLKLRNVTFDAQQIAGSLAVDEIFLTRFPAHDVNPIDYPSVF